MMGYRYQRMVRDGSDGSIFHPMGACVDDLNNLPGAEGLVEEVARVCRRGGGLSDMPEIYYRTLDEHGQIVDPYPCAQLIFESRLSELYDPNSGSSSTLRRLYQDLTS